ncbi:MAG: hypothetical protein JW982_00295 [Spirochaetes bacterium]|nr:hypothetical protein [Spirochaetota bacterium]
MKKLIISILSAVILLSCESAPVKTEINESSPIENAKKIAIILRTPQNSAILREEIFTSVNSWLYGYFREKEIIFIPDFPENLTEYASQEESFFQLTPENEFLQHKSIGVLNQFVKENNEEINGNMEKNACDLLLIFEVNAVYSEAMQNMSYKTVIAVIGKNSNILHFDHQAQYAEITKPGYGEIKPDLLNRISKRLTDYLNETKFIRKI